MKTLVSEKTEKQIAESQWLELFAGKEEYDGFSLANPAKWFRDSLKNHEWLNKKLGDNIVEFKVDITSDFDVKGFEEDDDAKHYTLSLNQFLPQYVKEFNINWIEVAKSELVLGKFRPFKHISSYHIQNKIFLNPYINNYFSNLLNVKRHYKREAFNGFAYICTDPMIFSMLGHLGPDEGSCFRDTGENYIHKYKIGKTQDTFVFILSKAQLDLAKILSNIKLCGGDDLDTNIVGRCWGWIQRNKSNRNIDAIAATNFYIDSITIPTIQNAFEITAQKIIGTNEFIKILDGEEHINCDEVFSNGDELWIIKKDKKRREKSFESVEEYSSEDNHEEEDSENDW